MIGASHAIEMDRPQLGLVDRAAAWLAIGLSIWIFFEAGWLLLRPNDPLAPVSLMSGRSALLGGLGSALLAAVCAGAGTLLAGRRIADIGTFAASVGLVVLSLRGDTAEYFLLERTTEAARSTRGLALLFLVESVAWIGVTVVAAVVAGIVARWFITAATSSGKGLLPMIHGALDIPKRGRGPAGENPNLQTPGDVGIKHTAIVAAAGLFAFLLLTVGADTRQIQHGQAVFSAAAAVALGCYIAHQAAPVRSAAWSVLGAALLVLIGYLWAALRPALEGLPPTVPPSPFLRVLPIQFVGAGAAAAIAMSWYMYTPPEAEPSRPVGGFSRV